MTWKYALAALAGALLSWLWQKRGGLRRRRPAGSEELESVVEEFVATAELLLDDFDARRTAMEGLLAQADARIATLQGLEPGEGVLLAPGEPAPASRALLPPDPPAGPSEEAVRAATAMVAAARASHAAARLQGEAEAAGTSGSGRSGRSTARAGAKAPSTGKSPAGKSSSGRSSSGKPSSGKSSAGKSSSSKASAGKGSTGKAKVGSREEAGEGFPVAARHQDVLALAQRGMDFAEIARVTGRPAGEVQLILGLQRSLH